jgi:hypothetical protein
VKPPRRTEGEPHDRLTGIGNDLITALEARPDAASVRAIIMLEDGDSVATCLAGFERDAEAIATLFAHLAAIMRANGKQLTLLPIDVPGQG